MSQTSNALQTQMNTQLPPWLDPKNAVSPPQPTRKHKWIHFDLGQDDPDYAILKCPVCGFDYNHLTAVEVRGGIGHIEGVGTRIDASGTRVFGTHVNRGVAIDLEFSGECGHDYVYTLEFYKGQIQISQREMPGTLKSAIWRD